MLQKVYRRMVLPNGRKAEIIIIKDYDGNIVDWYTAKKESRMNNEAIRERMRKGA